MTVSGSGYQPGETVTVRYLTGLAAPHARVVVCTAVASPSGAFSCDGHIPTIYAGADGAHMITATGDTSHTKLTTTYTLGAATVSITPGSGVARQAVTVTGSGYVPGETVNVRYYTGLAAPNSSVLLCATTATATGGFSCVTRIPATYTGGPGAHTVTAVGVNSHTTATTTFTLT